MNLKTLDQEYVLGTYARVDVAFERGENAVLYDTAGKDYIDFGAGIAVCNVGHGNKRLAEALCDQASKLIHTSNLYLIEPQAKLAKMLVELSGYDARIFFANSGAEANEGAIKMARRYGEENDKPKRYKIITLENSFHGRTITALKATGQESMHNYFGPFPDGFVYAKSIDEVESLIDDHTVAVLIELVQGEGGVEPMPKASVQALAEHLQARNILLIVDEVQTGIYRTGELLASKLYGIEPDIVTLAKGLGGGVPIGAIMTRHKQILGAGEHGSTFGGNFLATRAGLEVLDILEAHKNSGELDRMMLYFEAKLEEIVKRYPDLFEKSVGIGFMRGLRVKDGSLVSKILASSLDKGAVVLKAGRNTVRFVPPLTITKEEINEGFARFDAALAAL